MADSIIRIDGIHPTIDGEYPFSFSGFTNRDFHDIKRISGVRPQGLKEAFEQTDMDLFVAFAVIALRHAGKSVVEDMLWDAPTGRIQIADGDEAEAEADDLPPASAPPSAVPSSSGGVERPSESEPSSGAVSRSDSALPENGQSRTGLQASDIGAMSPFETSAN